MKKRISKQSCNAVFKICFYSAVTDSLAIYSVVRTEDVSNGQTPMRPRRLRYSCSLSLIFNIQTEGCEVYEQLIICSYINLPQEEACKLETELKVVRFPFSNNQLTL